MSSARKPVGVRKLRSEDEVDRVLGNMNVSAEDAELRALAAARPASEVAADQQQKKKQQSEKERVTHFLSKDVLEQVEDLYDELRRSMPYKLKTKVKKSHLVEFALQTMVDEYKRLGRDSSVGRMIEDIRREHE